MRHIAALEEAMVPRDNEFKFRDRAQTLVNKWHSTVSSAQPQSAGGVPPLNPATGAAAVNGKANGASLPESAMSEGVAPPSTAGVESVGAAVGDMTMDTTLGDMTMTTDVAA